MSILFLKDNEMTQLFLTVLTIFFFGPAVVWANSFSLKFDYAVSVNAPSSDGLRLIKKYEPGEELKLEDNQLYWIESLGKVPVLVIPQKLSGGEPAKLQLPSVANWPPIAVATEIDKRVSEMMDLMTQFQIEMSKKNLAAAEQLLNRMTSIQNVQSLEFLRAYHAYMKGDFNRARTAVKKGLESYPNHVQGLQLLKTLEGGKSE